MTKTDTDSHHSVRQINRWLYRDRQLYREIQLNSDIQYRVEQQYVGLQMITGYDGQIITQSQLGSQLVSYTEVDIYSSVVIE